MNKEEDFKQYLLDVIEIYNDDEDLTSEDMVNGLMNIYISIAVSECDTIFEARRHASYVKKYMEEFSLEVFTKNILGG